MRKKYPLFKRMIFENAKGTWVEWIEEFRYILF